MRQSSLGKGLSALLKEEIVIVNNGQNIQNIDIDNIIPDEDQPRKHFEYEKIKELSESIVNNGLIQPIIVTKASNGKFKIIAGERRWRACKLAKFHEVPVIIKDLSRQKILEVALIENIQREDLSVIEEAEGYLRLIKEFTYTQDQLSEMLGKSRSHIANLLRLNLLPLEVKEMVNQGKLTMGHARCLVGNEEATIIAEYIVNNDLSVRQTENIIKEWRTEKLETKYNKAPAKSYLNSSPNSELTSLAKSLSQRFDIEVAIEEDKVGGGKLILNYKNLEELDNILALMS